MFFSKLGENKRRVFLFVTVILSILLAQGWLIFQLRFNRPEAEAQLPSLTASAVLSASPIPSQEPVISTQATVNVPVLMYHHIELVARAENDPMRALSVPKDKFEEHLSYLKNGGYSAISLADLYRKIAAGEATDKAVVLTFDDGYLDNFEVAWPVMQKYDFKGTFFVISNRVGTAGYMNREQIKALQGGGNEIGSHSLTHPDLTKLSTSKLKEELEGSKTAIGEIIGREVFSFCYPTGEFNGRIVSEVRSAGYKAAVTTQRWQPFSTENQFEISRFRVTGGTNIGSLIRY